MASASPPAPGAESPLAVLLLPGSQRAPGAASPARPHGLPVSLVPGHNECEQVPQAPQGEEHLGSASPGGGSEHRPGPQECMCFSPGARPVASDKPQPLCSLSFPSSSKQMTTLSCLQGRNKDDSGHVSPRSDLSERGKARQPSNIHVGWAGRAGVPSQAGPPPCWRDGPW